MIDASEREQNLFYEALSRGDSLNRAAFLDRACAGNHALRERVEELLAVQAKAEKFFAEAGCDLTLNRDQKQ